MKQDIHYGQTRKCIYTSSYKDEPIKPIMSNNRLKPAANEKKYNDNRHVKPFSSNKTPFNNNIILLAKDDIVTDSTACAKILNIYFCNSVENLEIDRELYANNAAKLDDSIDSIIEKFKDHPSILNINQCW